MAATRAASCACCTTAIRYKSAVGIDIARESVARADLLKGHRPVEYKVTDSAASLGRTFDYAFSHEVIYLLRDLAAHARDMKAAVRPGGSYVAAMGCHVDSAVWPRWRKLIAETSSIPIYDHSLEDVSKAFSEAGFTVGRAAARPRCLHAGDGGQRLLPQGRRPAALLQPGQGAVQVRQDALTGSNLLSSTG